MGEVRVRGWRRAAHAVRTAWLVFGAVLFLWLLGELAFRAQFYLRAAIARSDAPDHPFRDEQWFAEYLKEDRVNEQLRWKPFVYYRRPPYTGRHINIDSAGHRRTVQANRAGSSGVQRELWMFGGSTMWGTFQRDSATIPSLVAQRLQDQGIHDVHVTNFGESGYVFMQEVVELMLQLRDGRRPDVVLFYDGINDVAALVQNARAGLPQNEFSRARDFGIGRAMFGWRRDLDSESRALGTLASLSTARSMLVHRLQVMVAPRWQGAPWTRLAGEYVASYVGTARIVEALSREYGFEAIYIWQPSLHGTDKPLTPFEQDMMRLLDSQGFDVDIKNIQKTVSREIDPAMAAVAPGRFINAANVFAGESGTVFLDPLGHTRESANTPVINAFLPTLVRVLGEPAPRTR